MRDLLDVDIGRGPHLLALEVQPNFGLGEVIQGPKPKKKRKVVIEEQEYESLLILKEKIFKLEIILEEQLKMMNSISDAFMCRIDPFRV